MFGMGLGRLGLLAGGGRRIIDPSTLPNLAAWYRKGVGVTESGGLVSAWADQSGNGRNLVQATGTNQPALQGDGSILFDGIDNSMLATFTRNQPQTVYVLGKQVTWANTERWFDGSTGDRGTLQQTTASPQIRIFAGTGMGNISLAVDTYGIIASVFNGANSVLQLNLGTPVTGDTGSGGDMTGFRLGSRGDGAGAFGNVQIKEILIYAAAHDATTRQKVIEYLASVQEADDPDFFI